MWNDGSFDAPFDIEVFAEDECSTIFFWHYTKQPDVVLQGEEFALRVISITQGRIPKYDLLDERDAALKLQGARRADSAFAIWKRCRVRDDNVFQQRQPLRHALVVGDLCEYSFGRIGEADPALGLQSCRRERGRVKIEVACVYHAVEFPCVLKRPAWSVAREA